MDVDEEHAPDKATVPNIQPTAWRRDQSIGTV